MKDRKNPAYSQSKSWNSDCNLSKDNEENFSILVKGGASKSWTNSFYRFGNFILDKIWAILGVK